MTAANAPTVSPLHVTLTRPDGTSAAPPTVIVMALDAKELLLTVIPLGDVMPQALAVLAVTNPLGNVNVIFPVLEGMFEETSNETATYAFELLEVYRNVANVF